MADGVESFLEVDGQRQEIYAVARHFGSGGGGEYRGVAVFDEAGAVGQTCHLAGLDGQFAAGELGLKDAVIFKHAAVSPYK